MNKLLCFFVVFLPALMFGTVVRANTDPDDILDLEAVKNVFHTSVADKIDKTHFLSVVKNFWLENVRIACMESVEYHLEYSEKVNICYEFLKQIIAEHNRILDNSVPNNKSQFHKTSDTKIKSKSYYMAEVESNSYDEYRTQGVFDKNDTLVCLLDCEDWPYNSCKPDDNSDIAFACDFEIYPNKFFVGHKKNGTDDIFDFNNKYMKMHVTETLQSHMDRYKQRNYTQRKMSETEADYVDCANFLQKRFTPKTWPYIPEQGDERDSIDSDYYLDEIEHFNKTAAKAPDGDEHTCYKLREVYDEILAYEKNFDWVNRTVADFVSTTHTGDPNATDRISYVVNEIASLVKAVNDQAYVGYYYSPNYGWGNDNCTEISVSDLVYDDIATYHKQIRYTIQCPLLNVFLPPMQVTYRFIIDYPKESGMPKSEDIIDKLNYK